MELDAGVAAEDLLPELYGELREIAARHFARQPPGHTLQPTALVNEAYLKLAAAKDPRLTDRSHFLALASRVMRQILVDHERARRAGKRGGAMERLTLSEAATDGLSADLDVLALEEALTELAALSADKARLIELRFYGGLTETEAADVMGISRASATRQWRLVRAWLSRKLTGDDE